MTTLFDDADVISRYSRAQAISDVMADVTELAREAGFRYPVAPTRGAWDDLVAWDSANRGCQDETSRLSDVLNIARWGATRGSGIRKLMRLWRVPNTPRVTVPKRAVFVLPRGPGDDGESVVTIMSEGEVEQAARAACGRMVGRAEPSSRYSDGSATRGFQEWVADVVLYSVPSRRRYGAYQGDGGVG